MLMLNISMIGACSRINDSKHQDTKFHEVRGQVILVRCSVPMA